MKKHTMPNFEKLKKEHEQLLKKVKEEMDSLPKTKVYQDLLIVEAEINKSGKSEWVDSYNPTPWQNLIAKVVVYDNFHEGQDFGEKYLVGALEEYDKVYQHYIDRSDTNSPLKSSLDNLLDSIKATIEQCEKQKLKR